MYILREQGLQRLSDKKIVEKALLERRVILTHDLDFGRLVALSRQKTPSVITFRLDDMKPVNVNHYLDEALTHRICVKGTPPLMGERN